MRNHANRRPPFRDPPLPTAGQSLDRQLDEILSDGILPWLMAAASMAILAILAWNYYLSDRPPNPWVCSTIAAIVIAFAVLKIRKELKLAKRIALGRDGERIVAETLQRLVAAGWHVFHDVPADGFNIDHVAIGPGGVLAIETKTRTKSGSGRSAVVVTDDGISVAGRPSSVKAHDQAARQAKWLKSILEKSTGQAFFVRPVLLFPGWFIDDRRGRKEPWVLGHKELPAWVGKEPVRLGRSEVAMAKLHLDRYIRHASGF